MTKSDYIEMCCQRWDMIENLAASTTFYEHERDFDSIWTEKGREVLESSISTVPKDHRKKSQYRLNMAR